MLDKYKKLLKENKEIYLKVKVNPRSGKNEIKEIMQDPDYAGDIIKINITAPPLKGKANQELINFITKQFSLKKNNVKILSGQESKIKLLKLNKD